MGRIDEALRRAADSGGPPSEAVPEVPRDGAGDAFQSPWSFDPRSEAPTVYPKPPDVPLTEVSQPAALATVDNGPMLDAGVSFSGFNPKVAERLVTAKSVSPLLTEQFRRLAATLHHAQLLQGTKMVMVTSANPADGKSLTSTNLALTLSESYRRDVLLIDADLRAPTLHDIFQVPNVAGLNEGLKSDREGKLCAIKITPTLTLLPAGRPDPDPMSGLTSDRMRHILQEAAGRFQWIIIDTAPIGLLADAGILGGMVDGALLVIRAGRTRHPAVVKAVEAFGRDRILGVVLNAVEPRPEEEAAARAYGSAAPRENS